MEVTRGFLSEIKRVGKYDKGFPVVQVTGIKAMNAGASQRFRCAIGDGIEVMACMPGTQLNPLFQNQEITEYTVVRLVKYNCSNVQNNPVCVVLELEVLGNPGRAVTGNVNTNTAPAYAASNVNTMPTSNLPTNIPSPQKAMTSNYGNSMGHTAAPVNNLYQPQYNTNNTNNQPTNMVNNPYGSVQVKTQPQPAQQIQHSYQQPPPAAPQQQYQQPPQQYQPPPQQQQQQQYNNPYGSALPSSLMTNSYSTGPVKRMDAINNEASVVPISAINPYATKWTIKARVTKKSEIKRWSNAKGEGTLFSIDLLDSQGGEIRGTFFKDACDKFFPLLHEGKVYTFSNGVLKVVANRQYSNLKNQYEITFNSNSSIFEASDDTSIKSQNYHFLKLQQLMLLGNDSNSTSSNVVDVIGVVKTVGEYSEITSTKLGGKQLKKRDISIIDDTLHEIKVTLWEEKALMQEWTEMANALSNLHNTSTGNKVFVVAFKGLKVGDYNGKSLSTLNGSAVTINPKIPEGKVLYDWCNMQGGNVQQINITNTMSVSSAGAGGNSFDLFEKRKALLAIKDENLGTSDKADYLTSKAHVVYLKHDTDCWYSACPTCSKKVVENMSGKWTCEKCNKLYDECNPRYILNGIVADSSGSHWVTFFNEAAEQLLGVPAKSLSEMKKAGDEYNFEAAFNNALFNSVLLKLRVKVEMVNDEQRAKASVLSFQKVDYVNECQQMLDVINKYN